MALHVCCKELFGNYFEGDKINYPIKYQFVFYLTFRIFFEQKILYLSITLVT